MATEEEEVDEGGGGGRGEAERGGREAKDGDDEKGSGDGSSTAVLQSGRCLQPALKLPKSQQQHLSTIKTIRCRPVITYFHCPISAFYVFG